MVGVVSDGEGVQSQELSIKESQAIAKEAKNGGKIKLYQIGNSDVAVKFEVVEKPNDWTKEIKRNTSNSPYSTGKIRLLGCL